MVVKDINNKKEDADNILKIPERFIVVLNGKNFVQYEGLLELGHQKGIQSLETQLLQIPSRENEYTAIAQATVVGKNGTRFIDYGDASPRSVNSKIVPHIIRMACTRAKARVLRDFTNVGMTAVEELEYEDADVTIDRNDLITEKQKNLIQDNYEKVRNLFNSVEDVGKLSKQQASEIIGKYIFK